MFLAALKAIGFLGSSIYLTGLLYFMLIAERTGEASLRPDTILPYEMVLIMFLTGGLAVLFLFELRKLTE